MSIELKSISEVIEEYKSFVIPDYQRGYKWEKLQVIELLEDIRDYAVKLQAIKWDDNKYIQNLDINCIGSKEIYCIQPLVIKDSGNGEWNVVDGQQRLTTIFLILKFLNENNLYSIDYKTRDGSKKFLEDIENKTNEDVTNVDFFNLKHNWDYIKDWFKKKENENIKDCIKNIILEEVNFILYKIADSENEIDVFNRLNIGRIPLTDGELIKALFLNSANFDINKNEYQQRIAMQWDEIEYRLQNDEFWLFLHNKEYNSPTRIDYLLELVKKRNALKLNESLSVLIGEHSIFQYYNEAFKTGFEKYISSNIDDSGKKIVDINLEDTILKVWEEVRALYFTFEEWYQNQELFHYIGYLVTVSEEDPINDLLDSWFAKGNRKDFIGSLGENQSIDDYKSIKKMIYEVLIGVQTDKINGKKVSLDLDNFEYEDKVAKAECKPILLFHNIETIVRQNRQLIYESKYNLPNYTKFPFHLYKKDRWDVEHIRPNSGDNLRKEEDRLMYLELTMKYLGDEEKSIRERIHEFIEKGYYKKDKIKERENEERFIELRKDINNLFDALDYTEKNKIWNYTLLDKKTNIQYSNYIFPIKRAFVFAKEQGYKLDLSSMSQDGLNITTNERQISFVPICTRNIFAKYYTKKPTNMSGWTKDDAKAYLEDMKDKLKEYIDEANKYNEGK